MGYREWSTFLFPDVDGYPGFTSTSTPGKNPSATIYPPSDIEGEKGFGVFNKTTNNNNIQKQP